MQLVHSCCVLAGTLPADWGARDSTLVKLDLGLNYLRGTLPPEWALLPNLTLLFLDNNLLEGKSLCLQFICPTPRYVPTSYMKN